LSFIALATYFLRVALQRQITNPPPRRRKRDVISDQLIAMLDSGKIKAYPPKSHLF
jgi:hypothetical protein